ncbi:MAG: cytoplasmic protein [Candidatus Methanomethylicota archaeon]|uniref:Cytoplasmic protein n=1 Tax=Thermoproteota archaeon TaxID=2056631 RepID=A0A497F037_9CREN|nr:MAG: cytoplasmic protein [Candidatus Verstraetearchaeota archaeon]
MGREEQYLINALTSDSSINVTHMTSHEARAHFPKTSEELSSKFDVVILTDVTSDSIILYSDLYSVPMGPNRLKAIEQFVKSGGGLLLIGGWASFGCYMGQARYHGTPVEDALPVLIKDRDDRVEVPEGFRFKVVKESHPIMKGIPWSNADFLLLGYNKLKLKSKAELLAEYNGDPIIAVWKYGSGRSMIFASDCAPRWVGSFIKWSYYSKFWIQAVKWLAKLM